MLRSLLLGSALTLTSTLTAAMPVVFQDIPEIANKFDQPDVFCKSTPTLGRLPAEDTIGQQFPTYISDGKDGATLETTNTVTDSVVIARMPEAITGDIYNEWLIQKDYWKKTYGELPTDTSIKSYYRVKPIKAVAITDEILTLLDTKDGKTATIMIPWDTNGMVAHKGGYLAGFEYAIAPEEMKANYQQVDSTTVRCNLK